MDIDVYALPEDSCVAFLAASLRSSASTISVENP
jgi:hypothetical protein